MKPIFSIIIPTYNRPEQLTSCLESFIGLDTSNQDFEVVVVDDGSSTSLEPVVARFCAQFSLTLIRQENAGPAAARNTGAIQAQGRYLVFTDDDCTPAPDWLTKLATRLATAPEAMIGGRTLNALERNRYSTASQVLIDCLYAYHNSSSKRALSNFFTTNNLALPSEQFRAFGGFDTTFSGAAGEDRELCDRWLHHGYQMVYAPEVQVTHAHHLTLPTFWQQHFNYGRAALYFLQARASRTDESLQAEPLKFLSTLLTYPFRHKMKQPVTLTALLMVSQVADVAGHSWERFKVFQTTVDQPKPKLALSNLGPTKK